MNDAHERIQIEAGWKAQLLDEFSQPYMQSLRAFLLAEQQHGKQVYPPGSEIFNAFNSTPLAQVQVVILGQDPYHGPGQAHGLCFSVRAGVAVPPSLRNIFKELQSDLGCVPPGHGNLQHWAEQGVLLLNSVLTVERGLAAAHQGKGWEQFTDRVVDVLNRERQGLVFMLWGNQAQKKGQMIDRQRHLVLSAPHPSPLSASRGFFGCKHFSQANRYLQQQGRVPINWGLPPDLPAPNLREPAQAVTAD